MSNRKSKRSSKRRSRKKIKYCFHCKKSPSSVILPNGNMVCIRCHDSKQKRKEILFFYLKQFETPRAPRNKNKKGCHNTRNYWCKCCPTKSKSTFKLTTSLCYFCLIDLYLEFGDFDIDLHSDWKIPPEQL